MQRSIDRERLRKRRVRARKAAARVFERPIQAALEERANARHQIRLDRLHDSLMDQRHDTLLIPTARPSPSQPTPAILRPSAVLRDAATAAMPQYAAVHVEAAPASADQAHEEAPLDAAEPPLVAPQGRPGFVEMLRRFRESLFLPVLLAIAAISLANRLPTQSPPGAHLPQAAAIGTALPPAGTPEARSVAAITPNATALAGPSPPLIALPPGETISAWSTPARNAGDGVISARETDFLPRTRACTTSEVAAFKASEAPVEPNAFGVALAAAAEAQTNDFVVYNDEYFNLRYPGGDVPPLYGVCSDVVIRAYRALGVDLQRLVHEARVGSGDTSIDHRRTETLRRFFARHGTKLAVTDFADDYRPGDIVSYERPQNRGAQVHIAIVSNQIGPSGHPMIVHNRGWGPQIEDALFVDHITGHYRMTRQPKLLTSWGINKSHGRGLDSWSTLVRRAAIVRGSGRTPKAKSNSKL